MSYNKRLNTARKSKDDEYYTQYEMVQCEMKWYEPHFYNKHIHCPCDNPISSFVKYFQKNYRKLNLSNFTYSSADFNAAESKQQIEAADIVVTNPPFSKLKQFYNIIKHKKFLIVVSNTFVTRKYVLSSIYNQNLWLGKGGISSVSEKSFKFIRPDGSLEGAPYLWLQNLQPQYYEGPITRAKVPPTTWQKYDDFDAYEVKPVNYVPHFLETGVKGAKMGTPISFISAWNPARFKLHYPHVVNPLLNGKKTYDRLIVSEIPQV